MTSTSAEFLVTSHKLISPFLIDQDIRRLDPAALRGVWTDGWGGGGRWDDVEWGDVLPGEYATRVMEWNITPSKGSDAPSTELPVQIV